MNLALLTCVVAGVGAAVVALGARDARAVAAGVVVALGSAALAWPVASGSLTFDASPTSLGLAAQEVGTLLGGYLILVAGRAPRSSDAAHPMPHAGTRDRPAQSATRPDSGPNRPAPSGTPLVGLGLPALLLAAAALTVAGAAAVAGRHIGQLVPSSMALGDAGLVLGTGVALAGLGVPCLATASAAFETAIGALLTLTGCTLIATLVGSPPTAAMHIALGAMIAAVGGAAVGFSGPPRRPMPVHPSSAP